MTARASRGSGRRKMTLMAQGLRSWRGSGPIVWSEDRSGGSSVSLAGLQEHAAFEMALTSSIAMSFTRLTIPRRRASLVGTTPLSRRGRLTTTLSKNDVMRSRDWGPEHARDFEEKLQRSRRKAYWLGFKAAALSQSTDPEARAASLLLYRRVLADFPDELADVALAHQALGQAHAERGEFVEAEAHLRLSVATHGRFEKGHAYDGCHPALELAELLVTAESTEKDDEAKSILDALDAEHALLLPEDLFRAAVACARISARGSRAGSCKTSAERALALAREHDVELDETTRAELESYVARVTW